MDTQSTPAPDMPEIREGRPQYGQFSAGTETFLRGQQVDGLWATKSEGVVLIVRAISFQDFQPIVHCAVKMTAVKWFVDFVFLRGWTKNKPLCPAWLCA